MLTIKLGLAMSVVAIASLPAAAATPTGKFQCLRYQSQGGASPYGHPVAYIWLRANGAYDLLDLTITKAKTSGQYIYGKKKRSSQIRWTLHPQHLWKRCCEVEHD